MTTTEDKAFYALALALIATFFIAKVVAESRISGPCNPQLMTTDRAVLHQCGAPKTIEVRLVDEFWRQEEWDYGATFVGFVNNQVAYVSSKAP